jgi:DNA-binding transcriptional regulator YhcF (GntR family)
MEHILSVDHTARTPKYQQLIDAVLQAIDQSYWQQGQQLPSVNELSEQYGIARMTVLKAYDELRRRGIIESQHGKGYYVATTNVKVGLNIFLLFDELSAYKETLYNAFRESLPSDTKLHLYFHHHNRYLFENLLSQNIGRYQWYVILPHFNVDITASLSVIPAHQLILLDRDLPQLGADVASVHQDFEADIQTGLLMGLDLLRKYRRINMVCPSAPLAYIPEGRNQGFVRFCQQNKIPYRILTGFDPAQMLRDEAYLLFDETELVRFIKFCRERDWELGTDIGLITYDDTPYKEIIANGLTVISTDFRGMGVKAAHMIMERRHEKIHNDCQLIIRGTL